MIWASISGSICKSGGKSVIAGVKLVEPSAQETYGYGWSEIMSEWEVVCETLFLMCLLVISGTLGEARGEMMQKI